MIDFKLLMNDQAVWCGVLKIEGDELIAARTATTADEIVVLVAIDRRRIDGSNYDAWRIDLDRGDERRGSFPLADAIVQGAFSLHPHRLHCTDRKGSSSRLIARVVANGRIVAMDQMIVIECRSDPQGRIANPDESNPSPATRIAFVRAFANALNRNDRVR